MTRGPVHPLFGLLFLIASVGTTTQTPAQTAPPEHSSPVTFYWSTHQEAPPMKIVHIRLGDREIALDTPVPVEGMWMRNISVTLMNVSPKTIVKCGVSVDFPETWRVTRGPVPSIEMSKGKHPQHARTNRDGTVQKPDDRETEFLIPPGSFVTFRAPDGADWDQEQAYKLVDRITKVTVNIGPTFFSDESAWMGGSYLLPVPPPELWRKVTPEQFIAYSPASRR